MKLLDLSTSKKMYGIDEKCGSVTFVLFCFVFVQTRRSLGFFSRYDTAGARVLKFHYDLKFYRKRKFMN